MVHDHLRVIRLGLFCGSLLVMLSIWAGPHGYYDLRQLLNDTEGLWLHGDLSHPGQPGEPRRSNFWPIGLPLLSGPLVYVGTALEFVSFGLIGRRWIIALIIPLLAAGAVVLLFEIGRLLKVGPRAAFWSAALMLVGSQALSFTRLYYYETAVLFCCLLAVWAFLHAERANDKRRPYWLLAAGGGLAGVTLCQYGNVWTSACLMAFLGGALLVRAPAPPAVRLRRLGMLALLPLVGAAGLLGLNYARHGHLFAFEMTRAAQDHFLFSFTLTAVAWQIGYLKSWLLWTPWLAAGIVSWYLLYARHRALALGVVAAFVTQTGFWLSFGWFADYYLRYMNPLVGLCALGLLAGCAFVQERLNWRWLEYGGLALVLYNLYSVVLNNYDGMIWLFRLEPDGFRCHTWYVTEPIAESLHREGLAGAPQAIVFAVFMLAGLGFLGLARQAAWAAWRQERGVSADKRS